VDADLPFLPLLLPQFIIEGIITVLVGASGFYWIQDFPSDEPKVRYHSPAFCSQTIRAKADAISFIGLHRSSNTSFDAAFSNPNETLIISRFRWISLKSERASCSESETTPVSPLWDLSTGTSFDLPSPILRLGVGPHKQSSFSCSVADE
jgi:hypothetical protein